MKDFPPAPMTFPARPMNGGKLEMAEPLVGDWRYRPKYNGRRVLFHTPTMRTWNRQLEETNWGTKPAFKRLKEILEMGEIHPMVFDWIDCEFLWGRHGVGKGAVIVLDYVSVNELWYDRQANLMLTFQPDKPLELYEQPQRDKVYFTTTMRPENSLKCWEEMKGLNKEWGVTFYEGLVAYELRSHYPVQLFNPLRETRHWVKYRFVS